MDEKLVRSHQNFSYFYKFILRFRLKDVKEKFFIFSKKTQYLVYQRNIIPKCRILLSGTEGTFFRQKTSLLFYRLRYQEEQLVFLERFWN